jgi:DNA adenine methylase
MQNNNENVVRPFLRWAGGKRWLINDINKEIDISRYNVYHEPFVGGGSIFFNFKPKRAYISDSNSELINAYNQVKFNPDKIISELKQYPKDKDSYYVLRSAKFNSDIQEAARFIYLNQMSYNGIYRVNKKGEYNVPYGYREKYVFDYNNIFNASKCLAETIIQHLDFVESVNYIHENDLVFIDPPYTVAHNNNGFVQYNQKIFSLDDQYKLASMILKIKENGAFYYLTNAAHKIIREIFNNGDLIIEKKRACLIGGKNAKRGHYEEIIVTNI